MSEIALRSGVGAISADAGLSVVEINLHNPAFAPDMLDQEGEPGFDAFARVAAAVPQECRLGGLLADRRPAADPAARRVALRRILDRFEVEAVMLAEFAVFGGDRRADHVAVHVADRPPVVLRVADGDVV